MLRFSSQSLFDFYDYVNICILDGVPFKATWKNDFDFRIIDFKDGVLTTLCPTGRRQVIINDFFINQLKHLYQCVLNPSKLLLPKLDM